MTATEDWAQDLAHLALVDATRARLQAAEAAVLAAEKAAVEYGQELAAGRDGGTDA
ncbi:hypothetical protein [Streptomyces heilongjiangensis]|uniref:Uncharacterized protein n=1 Tax=Streptomyces heilongjiangensis TaxID=945052 RepID=A0ABW1BIP2_9ACTN|nr:hypothetical protein [Streptomyces heilongjiangensis]MDC2951039.1 hypothetical protein [Streptomyces heilongjiangensis]